MDIIMVSSGHIHSGSMCQNCMPWACGGCLGHEGGALLSGIRALVNETLESSFAPFCHRGHSEKAVTCPTGKWALTRHQTCPCLHLELEALPGWLASQAGGVLMGHG